MRLEDQKEMAYHALTNNFRVPPLVLQSTLLTRLGNPAGATKHTLSLSASEYRNGRLKEAKNAAEAQYHLRSAMNNVFRMDFGKNDCHF